MRFALWSRLAHHYNGSLNIPTENVALPGEAANNSDEDKESEPTREHMDEPQSPSASFVNNERGTHSAHCSSVSPLSSISLESLSTPAADDQVQFSLQFATSLLTNIIPSIKQVNLPTSVLRIVVSHARCLDKQRFATECLPFLAYVCRLIPHRRNRT